MNTLHHIAPFRFALLLLVLPALGVFAQAPLDDAGYPTGQAPPDGAFLPDGIEATGDTAEVRALTAWAEEHRQTDPRKAQQVTERALTLAKDIDDPRGAGESLRILGKLAYLASNLSEAETYLMAAREAFEQVGDEPSLIRSQLDIGIVYESQGKLEDALSLFYNALKGFERLDNIEGQARVLNNIGLLHDNQGNLEESLDHYERAAILAERLDDPALLINILSNSGIVHSAQHSYEEAEIHFRRALAISEEQKDKYSTAAISTNIGYLFNTKRRFRQALPYLFNAEKLATELGNNGLLSAVYDELGKTHLGLEQYEEALRYTHQSLALTREAGFASQQMLAHQTLSRIYEALGDDSQALTHYQQYAALRDSVFTAEKTETIAQIQARYETEEKQRAIERFEQENRIQAFQLILLLGGIAVAVLIAGLFYYRYRVKRKANRLLEELDTAKSRFFANISHEFRTPLTVILGGLKDTLAGRLGNVPENVTEQQRAMLRNTRRLQGLIDEVLDLSRLEAGKLELQPAPGDLVRLLQRLVEADAPLAERNGIDLTFEHNVEYCPRLYDQEKLEKIVSNLLSNALKFTPKGGLVRVRLICGKETEIEVSDNGPSIPEELQEKVFERFTQVEDGALHGGTGIGLALAKELSELHGGTITLDSEPGEGSTFTVRLPLDEVSFDDVGASRVYDPAPGGGETPLPQTTELASPEEFDVGEDGADPLRQPVTEEGDRTTVLVIEDNDDVRAFVRRSLEATYRVLEAADGEAGLQQARSEPPDLIVSDIMLPGIDGYEVARQLKAEAMTECIPVVMLTARTAEEDQTEGYGSGAEVYITKPFSPETLQAALARLLEERLRLRRRLRKDAKREGRAIPRNGQPTLSDRARIAVLERLHDDEFGVEELASALGMTRRTLYRRLSPEVGLTPGDFVRTLRLERAKQLLVNGAGSVSEIAYAIGFKSISHFTRSFRKHYGKPPSSVLETRVDQTGQ